MRKHTWLISCFPNWWHTAICEDNTVSRKSTILHLYNLLRHRNISCILFSFVFSKRKFCFLSCHFRRSGRSLHLGRNPSWSWWLWTTPQDGRTCFWHLGEVTNSPCSGTQWDLVAEHSGWVLRCQVGRDWRELRWLLVESNSEEIQICAGTIDRFLLSIVWCKCYSLSPYKIFIRCLF